MRILLVAPQLPWPPHQGTAVRNWNVARQLASRHSVTLLGFGDGATDARLRDAGVEPVGVAPPPPRALRRRLLELTTTATPDLARRLLSSDMCLRLAAVLDGAADRAEAFEVVQIEGLEMAAYGLAARDWLARREIGARLIYDAHNAEWVLQNRAWRADMRRVSGWPGAGYSVVQTWKLRRYEARLLRAMDATVAVSSADRNALESLAPRARVVDVPNGVDTGYFSPADARAAVPGRCLFVGKMDFRPNIDAMAWFGREAWPLVRAERRDSRLSIVGRDPAPRVLALQGDGIEVVGEVDDVRPLVAAASAVVVPLRVGGGTRLKILEAMAMAKAVVATPMAAEGLNVSDGRELLLADDPAGLARALLDVLSDGSLRERLGQEARQCVERHYRWESLVPRMESLYA